MTDKKQNAIKTAIEDLSGDTTSTVGSSSSGLIGKSAGGDFTTAYLAATTITLGVSPYTHTYIADDITAVIQINTGGSVVATYTRDDVAMTLAASVLTVTGATFAASDTFIIYTNIPRVQILNTENLTAVTAVVAGIAIDVSTYDSISVYVDSTSVTTGATFTFQSSPQQTATDALWGTVSSTGSSASSSATQVITANGMYLFQIDVRKMRFFRANITAYTDGTYSVTVVG